MATERIHPSKNRSGLYTLKESDCKVGKKQGKCPKRWQLKAEFKYLRKSEHPRKKK